MLPRRKVPQGLKPSSLLVLGGTAEQVAEKLWLWVAQRFSAATEPLFPSAALAAKVTNSTFSAASEAVPYPKRFMTAFCYFRLIDSFNGRSREEPPTRKV